jgi:hypothetical protein
MHRVFFDTNAGTMESGFVLWFDQSRRDIETINPEDRDGASVTLYMPDEIEMAAVLRYDSSLGCWRGFPAGEPSD